MVWLLFNFIVWKRANLTLNGSLFSMEEINWVFTSKLFYLFIYLFKNEIIYYANYCLIGFHK